MKKLLFSLSMLLLLGSFAYSQPPRIGIDVILGNRPPAPREAQLMRQEENSHPNIAKAMRDIQKSLQALHDAPDDFGGHKGQAESDLRAAYMSLRKALYFRLYEDRH
jgi:hypothetical protein